jgi:tRNA(fMet)-specific endonuclease VapC
MYNISQQKLHLGQLPPDSNPRLLSRLQQSAADIHLPVIVIGEYRYGVKSSRLRAARESWLDELESSAIVLTVTAQTSRIYADIRHELRMAGQPIPENDLRIAALARQHGLPILTNDAHFDQVSGLGRIGW